MSAIPKVKFNNGVEVPIIGKYSRGSMHKLMWQRLNSFLVIRKRIVGSKHPRGSRCSQRLDIERTEGELRYLAIIGSNN